MKSPIPVLFVCALFATLARGEGLRPLTVSTNGIAYIVCSTNHAPTLEELIRKLKDRCPHQLQRTLGGRSPYRNAHKVCDTGDKCAPRLFDFHGCRHQPRMARKQGASMNIWTDGLTLWASFMACFTFWNLRGVGKKPIEQWFITVMLCFTLAFTFINVVTAIVHIARSVPSPASSVPLQEGP